MASEIPISGKCAPSGIPDFAPPTKSYSPSTDAVWSLNPESPDLPVYMSDLSSEYAKLCQEAGQCFDMLVRISNRMMPHTVGRRMKIENYCMFFGKMLGLADTEIQRLRLAVILHDIGDTDSEDQVLRKAGEATEEACREIEEQVLRGSEILGYMTMLESVLPSGKHRNDRGYSDRLTTEETDILVRIITVSDAFVGKMNALSFWQRK